MKIANGDITVDIEDGNVRIKAVTYHEDAVALTPAGARHLAATLIIEADNAESATRNA